MCTVKNNKKNKMNLPLPLSTVFLIAEKLPSLRRLLNVQTFSLCYQKVRVIAWVNYFVLRIHSRWAEKSNFSMDFNPI